MTPVSAIRFRHPDWEGLKKGPELIRITFDDGSQLEGAPDCGDATFRAALHGDADRDWPALTVEGEA